METEEKRKFYVGITECGCITAALVDDEKTTAKEIAQFARDMHKTKRRMEHRELSQPEFAAMVAPCAHLLQPNASFSRGPSGPSAGSDS